MLYEAVTIFRSEPHLTIPQLMGLVSTVARQPYTERQYTILNAYGVDLVRTSLNGTHWSSAEMLVDEMLATDWIVVDKIG